MVLESFGGGVGSGKLVSIGLTVDKASVEKTKKQIRNVVANIKSISQITEIGEGSTKKLNTAFSDLKTGVKTFESMVADVNKLEFLEKAQKSLKDHGVHLTDAKGNLRDYGTVTKEMMLLKKKDTAGYHSLIKNIHAMELGIEDNTNAFHRFKGELMSVMFFGMQLAAVFGGMLEPAKKMVGTTEILSAIFGLMFLPEMLKVNEALFKFWEFMDRHPELTRIIKLVIILGFVLGTILFSIGWIGLGITGLSDFGTWMGVVGGKAKIFAGRMITNFALMTTSILTWASTFVAASWSVKISMLTALLPMIAVMVLVVWALRVMYKHWDWFAAQFSKIINGAWDAIVGFGNIVLGIFQTLAGILWGFISGDFTMFHNGIARITRGVEGLIYGLVDVFVGVASVLAGILAGIIFDVADALNWISRKLGKGDIIDVATYRAKVYGGEVLSAAEMNIPSLTDNLLPETGGVGELSIPTRPGGTYESTNNITINNPVIRDDMDIDKLAAKIADIQNMNITGLGGT